MALPNDVMEVVDPKLLNNVDEVLGNHNGSLANNIKECLYPYSRLEWHALWSCHKNDGTLVRSSLSCIWLGTLFLVLGFSTTCLAIWKVKNKTSHHLNVGIRFFTYFDLFS